jgi:hypothetical protein
MEASNQDLEKQQNDLNKRGVEAMESIAKSLEGINDWVYTLNTAAWSERLEWYLNEFYLIAKAKNVGSSDRPKNEYDEE